MSTKVGLIADIHMRNEYKDKIQHELHETVQHLEEVGVEHIIIMGDIIEDEGNEEDDMLNTKSVQDVLSQYSPETTYMLGNHDVETLSKKQIKNILEQSEFYGKINIENISLIYLDSSSKDIPGARGELGTEQREWLRRTIQEVSNPIVLSHHPIGFFDLSDNQWFRHYPERAFLGDRKEVLDLFETGGSVIGTINGHIHENHFGHFRDIPHKSLNAFSKETRDKPFTGTYATINIDEAVMIHSFVSRSQKERYCFPLIR